MAIKRKLFCEISPLTYRISTWKECCIRHLQNVLIRRRYATTFAEEVLPVVVYRHRSLILRKLGNTDMRLQENKAVNLALSIPKVNGVLIRPGETFSFWRLVGKCTRRKGYLEGLTIKGGDASSGIGGGMCQFTNLIHWLVLHSPLTITEHHHHNGLDLFPDFGRQIPFGAGTSILYNYLDYRFMNATDADFQLLVSIQGSYLCGELRASQSMDTAYHVYEDAACFCEEDGIFYRNNVIRRRCVDKRTGDTLSDTLLCENHARVLYDSSYIDKALLRK